MNKKICDLHIHSVFSDGTFTPAEIINSAIQKNISAIALTDHNTVSGLPDFFAAAENTDINAVGGTEFTTDYKGMEFHLLGLFFESEKLPAINEYLDMRNAAKDAVNKAIIEKMRADGFDISYEEFRRDCPLSNRNRANIGALLVKKGYVHDVHEAFEKYLHEKSKYFVPSPRFDFFDTIKRIHAWGGVAVWAHPAYSTDIDTVEKILPVAVQVGLDGAEAYYSCYAPQIQAKMLKLCSACDILPSGGSDFHGANKPDIAIGCGKGELAVPYSCYEALRERAAQYK